jgi:hypothetical protein
MSQVHKVTHVPVHSEASGSFNAIQSITLPDGSSFQFAYDSGDKALQYHTGELTSMHEHDWLVP